MPWPAESDLFVIFPWFLRDKWQNTALLPRRWGKTCPEAL
jgi:hypothetical protein